jgi:hypothetical protein
MPKSNTIKNIDPYRVRAKNDYVESNELFGIYNNNNKTVNTGNNYKIKSKKFRNNNTNLINLNDKLLLPEIQQHQQQENETNLYKLIISSKKLNNDENYIEIRTLPIDLRPIERDQPKKKSICCCCKTRRNKNNKIRNCIDFCSCVFCLNFSARKCCSSPKIDLCACTSTSTHDDDDDCKSTRKIKRKKCSFLSISCYFRFTCLSALALTLMPCLLFYWPLRLFNDLVFKCCCCCSAATKNNDSSCKCEKEDVEGIFVVVF